MTAEQQAAVARIVGAALAAERATGCPAELTAAQCILESGYLQHAPKNNCFGIKAYPGCYGTQLLDTSEWFSDGELARFLAGNPDRSAILVVPVRKSPTGRKLYACRDAFATFPTLADCFAYHGELLKRGPYLVAWEQYQSDRDLDAYLVGIAKHYATDPKYADQVRAIAGGRVVAGLILAGRGAVDAVDA